MVLRAGCLDVCLLGLEVDRGAAWGWSDLRSTLGPEQGTVLDTSHNIIFRDQLAVEGVEDDGWTRDGDNIVGWGWHTLLGVEVLVSMAVRLRGGKASGGQVDELLLHFRESCVSLVQIWISMINQVVGGWVDACEECSRCKVSVVYWSLKSG